MSKWIPWVVAIAAILVLGGGWLHNVRNTQQQIQQAEHRLAALEQAVTADTRAGAVGELQPLDADGRAAFAERVKGRMNAAGATTGTGIAIPSNAEIKRQEARDHARLEARFTSDGSDPSWAQGIEVAATQAIAAPPLAPFDAPAGSDMRCARTMCRMTFTFDSAGAASDWATYYPLGVTSDLPVMQSVQTKLPDGRVQLVMYGFRDPKAKPLQ